MKVKLHKGQMEVVRSDAKYKVITAGRRWGKALDLETDIPLYDGGFKKLSEIKVGDVVIDGGGNPTNVTGTQTFEDRPSYKVVFSDGTEVIADKNHEWLVWDKPARKAFQRAKNPEKAPYITETKEMVGNLTYGKKKESNFSIKNCRPVDYETKKLPIHPYLLGFWLGDGTSRGAEITVSDSEILKFIKSLGYEVGKCHGKYQWRVYGIQSKLRKLGLIQNKHIPDIYLYSSVKQRTWLLKGLMDSDGTVGKGGRCQFDQIDKDLTLQVQQLLHSLGQKTVLCEKDATLNGRKISNCYRINFTPWIEVFHLKRKLKRQNLDRYYSTREMRYVTNIKKVENRTTKCLEVDSPSHLFLITDRFIPTHNSVLSRMWVLKLASEQRGTYWIVSPTFAMAKEIHWKQGFLDEIPARIISSTNKQELEIKLVNGSRIALKSAENPDRLRGVKLNGLVIDEIAQMRNWDWLWEEVLQPTLADYDAPAMFISTPKGYNHFFNLYQKGQKNSDKYDESYQSFHYSSYDNPHVPSDFFDRKRKEIPEETFAQEYMAEFKTATGLVYKQFKRHIHVVKPFPIPDKWEVYRGMDFGSNNPTVCLWVAKDPDGNLWVINEHYESEETIDFHAGRINAESEHLQITATYGDPTGQQWLREFSKRGVHITKANKETGTTRGKWILYGINRIQELLKVKPGHFVDGHMKKEVEGMPQLFVFNNCKHTIEEFETYRWRENPPGADQDLNEPDTPEKANDHAMDALRYIVVSYDRSKSTQPSYQWNTDQWKIGKR